MVEKIVTSKVVLKNISKHLTKLTTQAIEKAFDIKNFDTIVTWSSAGKSDLCSPSAVKLYNMNCRKEGWKYPTTKDVAEEIVKNIPKDDIIKEVKISAILSEPKKEKPKKEEKNDENSEKKEKVVKPKAPESYYIDFYLNDEYLINLATTVLNEGVKVESEIAGRKALVDFSSPNIAKEMHVGHLRSTILGESICRVLEFLNVDVMRINHVGDWGTQFGMLIANLEEEHPDYLTNKPEIDELEAFYVQSKKKFENLEKPEFKKRAYENTVKLQAGDPKCKEAWEFICDASRKEFEKIYKRLHINVKECGESFYNPLMRKLVPELEEKGLVIKDQGAKIMRLDGIKTPMMIVKSDGGFTYDTTDLAAVSYRLNDLQRDWIIYVIGNEQADHVKAIAQAAKQLGLHDPSKTRIDHMAFGLMLNEKGKKISTSEGGLVKLTDLLDKARDVAKSEMKKRSEELGVTYSEEELNESAEKIGYSAVKYFDMKQTREGSYKFSYDFILDPKGNTAVYLFYNYVRLCSLEKKLGLNKEKIEEIISKERIVISHEKERILLINLLKFKDILDEVVGDLALNKLADYVYLVCVKFSEFFDECRIMDSEFEKSRILLTLLTRKFLDVGFDLLNLTPVERI
jgi:arginyl-tRNA synthetase